ncbi:MAG: hypothetical protein WCA79_18110 [Anaerolineales bacterium]
MNGPVGGFLEEYEVELITSVIPTDERKLLQKLSDEDVNVQQTLEYINNLPDLINEQWKEQIVEWDKMMKEHNGSDSTAV